MGSHGQSYEVLILEGGLTPHLPVSGPEGVGQSLDVDTGYNEVVKGELLLSAVILGKQVLDKGWSEPIAHLLQGLAELCLFDEATSVTVYAFEQAFPLVDVGEEACKLLHIDLSSLVPVEHVNHHSTGLLAKVAPVSVNKSSLQLL